MAERSIREEPATDADIALFKREAVTCECVACVDKLRLIVRLEAAERGNEQWHIENDLIREYIGTMNGGLADAVRSYIFNLAPVGPKPKQKDGFDPAISR